MKGVDRFREFQLENEYPGWRTDDDIFAWFDKGNMLYMSDKVHLMYWPESEMLAKMGMPQDLTPVEVVMTVRKRGKKFKDYVYCHLGIIANEDNPTKGETGNRARIIIPSGEILVHMWGVLLMARNVKTVLLGLWNVDIQPYFPTPYLSILPPRGWWFNFLNFDVFKDEEVIKLARGFKLLSVESPEITFTHKGRPSHYKATDDQKREFKPAYHEAANNLNSRMASRGRRQFSRYPTTDRPFLLKDAYPDAPKNLIKIMQRQKKASHAALHYAAWKIGIPEGTWGATQLYELMKTSSEG